MRNLYVVLSKTGTALSKIISRITGDKYTHASVSLDDDLETMYSFGRVNAYNPFVGGFVKESVHYSTMKRFRRSKISVLQVSVDDEKYKQISDYLQTMYANRKEYHYNYRGLFLARRGVYFHRDNCFYCSEFVKDLLERFNLVDSDEFDRITRPADLLRMRRSTIIYEGRLCDYCDTV